MSKISEANRWGISKKLDRRISEHKEFRFRHNRKITGTIAKMCRDIIDEINEKEERKEIKEICHTFHEQSIDLNKRARELKINIPKSSVSEIFSNGIKTKEL